MQPKLLILCALAILTGIMILWDLIAIPTSSGLERRHTKNLNIPAPDFSFITLDGKKHELSELKGKIIIINFWATWCTPCAVEFPDLIKISSAYPKDAVFIAISVDEKKDNVRRFLSRFDDHPQTNRIIALDPKKEIAQDIFQITKFPETFIIDQNLKIIQHIQGIITPPDLQNIQSLIDTSRQTP